MLHIFTLNWNGKEKLKELYESFNKLNKNFDYVWHIRDNKSSDDSLSYLLSLNDSKLNIISHLHNNDNFAQGMNALFEQSNAKDEDLILLLNNDVVFDGANDLNNMVGYFTDPNIGVLGCKLLFKNTDKIQHAGVVFNEQLKMPVHFGLNQKDSDLYSMDREFQVVTGAVMMIRKTCYEKICINPNGRKGMDESFIWAFDDVTACLDVKYKQNKKIVCYGKSKIYHEQSATLIKNPINKLFMNHNVSNLIKKWGKIYSSDKLKYSNPNYNLYKK